MPTTEFLHNSTHPTIHSCLRAATRHPDALAVLGTTRKALIYSDLLKQIEATVELLNGIGIGRGDKVAVALRNGPDAAICCLAVSSGAVGALVNPGYTAAEFESYLGDLMPKAIIVEEGSKSTCVGVAQGRGIPVIRLISDPLGPAGSFHLEGGVKGRPAQAGFAEPDDIALMVQTSGSTSRPKMAPLTHRNVCAGARNNVVQLELTEQDRCLCITNVFFTQAILVSVFSSLLAGGSVVCTPGYDPAGFFEWLDEFHPTWYSAPTSLQRSILAHAARHREAVSRSRLRLIRCSSSPAGPEFIAKMEELFRAPMLDSYGLTETSSLIAGERLPPARRKRGSVGVAVGCEIAIADEGGAALNPGEVGEVVVRGPGVLHAYVCAPEINQQAFRDGWLRTGDLGWLDEEGYLFLTGRSKEIINRGGVKISPAEIDEVLNGHPAVAEAAAFAVPHELLGEDVAAAIVLGDGWAGSGQLESELREFCAARLSAFKVPRQMVFLPEMPRSATGKTVRIGMAERLGLTAGAERKDPPETNPETPARRQHEPPSRGIVEMVLLHIWEEELGRRPVGVNDDFFDLGGDSLLGARLLARVEETFGKSLGLASLFEMPTVGRMASRLSDSASAGYAFGASKIIAIRCSGSLPPLFILGPQPLFRPLILELPEDLPVLGMSFPDVASLRTPYRLQDIAALQVAALRRYQPEGPYALTGWCADGVLAYEMAQQLRAQGQEVSLVMIDGFNPARWKYESRWGGRRDRLRFHFANLAAANVKEMLAYSRQRIPTLQRRMRQVLWRALYKVHLRTERRVGGPPRQSEQILSVSVSQYEPAPYQGPVTVIRPKARPAGTAADAAHGWRELAGDLQVVDVPGNHRDIFAAPNVGAMASAFGKALRDGLPVSAAGGEALARGEKSRRAASSLTR